MLNKSRDHLRPLEMDRSKEVRMMAHRASMILDLLESLEIKNVNLTYDDKRSIICITAERVGDKHKTIAYKIKGI